MIVLKIRTPEGEKEATFEKDSITIGRKPENDIFLEDRKASRFHAHIEQIGNNYRIMDTGSGNGTKVNQRTIISEMLSAGDEIQIGSSTITVVSTPTASSEAPRFPSAVLPPEPETESTPPPPQSATDIDPFEKGEELVSKEPISTERKLELRRKIDERVKAIDEERSYAAPSPRARAIRKLAGIAAGLVLVAAGAIGVAAALRNGEETPVAKKPTAKPAERGTESPRKNQTALQSLDEFRRKAEASPSVTNDLLKECIELGQKHAKEFSGSNLGANPFELLYNGLTARRAEAAAALLSELRIKVAALSDLKRFDQAKAALDEFCRSNPGLNEHCRDIMERFDESAQADYEEIRTFGERLESLQRFEEAATHYEENAHRFANTIYHSRLVDKPATLAEVAKAEAVRSERRKKDLEDLKKKWESGAVATATPSSPETGTGAPAAAPAPLLTPLTAMALKAVQAGKMGSLKLLDGLLAAADETGIEVAAADGKKRVAWNEIPVEALFTLYEKMGARDEDLLLVCEFGYVHGFADRADALLHSYVGSNKKERRAAADALIARVRGEAVPGDGYDWNAKAKRYESPAQVANREAAEKIDSLVAKIEFSSNVRDLEKAFDPILAFFHDPALQPDLREAVRTKAVAALLTYKEKRLKDLTARAKSSGNRNLGALKAELNRRRAEALKVIYDEKIYLPENHPDYPKGEKVNGQAKVDELVNLVKEIWETPGAVSMDPSLKRDVEAIQAINEKYLTVLGEKPSGNDLADYQEIVNNLNAAASLNIKSFSLSGKESQTFAWNRRVERYHAALKDPDINDDMKNHAKVLNDYREMMGRKGCFLDARICRATTKHSKACNDAGQIWHVGSDGSPQSRADAEGFSSHVSENVAIGYASPRDIWWTGWYKASDHHRNGLNDAWNCMGYGYVGSVGTQNFAAIGSPRGF